MTKIADKIKELHDAGKSISEIASEVNMTSKSVSLVLSGYSLQSRSDKVIELHDEGFDTKEIASKLNETYAYVYMIVRAKNAGAIFKKEQETKHSTIVQRNKVIREEFRRGINRRTLAKKYDLTYRQVYRLTADINVRHVSRQKLAEEWNEE